MVNFDENDQGRILIVDGDSLRGSGLAAFLKEIGFTVVGPISTGVEAVTLAKQQHLDLAIIEIGWSRPGSGTAVEKELTRLCRVPCILMAAPDYVPSRVLLAVENALNRQRRLQQAA